MTPVARYDYKNSLVFRTTTWCAPSDAAGTCSYDAAALAITSVFVNKKDGHIRDADIEVNSKNFIWTDLDIDPTAHGKQDLQNALAHEMGHLVGLDHTCVPAGVEPPYLAWGSTFLHLPFNAICGPAAKQTESATNTIDRGPEIDVVSFCDHFLREPRSVAAPS